MRGNGVAGDMEVANASSRVGACCAAHDGENELLSSNSITPQLRNSAGASLIFYGPREGSPTGNVSQFGHSGQVAISLHIRRWHLGGFFGGTRPGQ